MAICQQSADSESQNNVTCPGKANVTSEKLLVGKLLSEYGDTSVRPVLDHRQPVYVYFRMLLYELINLDQTQQKATIRSNMRLIWTDEYLQWDPDEYGGVYNITLKLSQIWRPDFVIDEDVKREFISLPEKHTYAVVQHTGLVDWLFPAITTTACKMNIEYFPFDVQKCIITVYPWTLDESKMRFFARDDEDALQKRYVQNRVWSLIDFKPENVSVQYLCCPHPNDHIMYTLTFQRESDFFVMNIVLPAIFLTVLMLTGFWLHPDSGEKVAFTVTNLLALILFQQLVADNMPPIGKPRSILVTCFFLLIALSGCSVFLTVLILRMYHHSGESPPPNWAIRLVQPFYGRRSRRLVRKLYGKAKNGENGIISTISHEIPGESLPCSKEQQFAAEAAVAEGEAEDIETASNSFLWKQFAIAFDSFCGTLLTFCMMGCMIYATVSFSNQFG
ncbi:neuronal acetylcholine receptor subunit alpha-10-like [Diadema setosum]|uniref:neuronal acetylcholine receptor subunit alpha-10-like n=1 Tax=Diadema setosum TaxID=31175 RepID=UPI003B3B01BF